MESRYEIDQDGAVNIYFNGSDVATLYQPTWPDGTEWADTAEASDWAALYIASVTDPDAPFAPNYRGEEPRPKPTAEQLAQMKADWEARQSNN